jgi:hypothetical protein
MPDVLTPIYDFTEPEVGGSDDTWGDKLNANWSKLDLLLGQAFEGGDFNTIGILNPDVLPPVGDTPYVNRAGDTMTGSLEIYAATPYFLIRESDVAADISRWSAGGSGGSFVIFPRTADGSTGSGFGSFSITRDAAGIVDARLAGGTGYSDNAPATSSLLTRARGDSRYLQLAGGTVGPLTVNGNFGVDGLETIRATAGQNPQTRMQDNTGKNIAYFWGSTSDHAALIRAYANDGTTYRDYSFDSLGNITNVNSIQVPANNNYNLKIGSTAGFAVNGSGHVAVRGVDETDNYMYYGGTGGPATAAGGAVILSRKMGDARYLLGVSAGDGLTGGGNTGTPTISMGTPGSITDTSVNGASGSTHTHSLSELSVRRLIAEGAVNVLGTYGMCYDSVVSSGRSQGSTLGGGSLMFCNADGGERSAALSGTWMLYGRTGPANDAHRTSLWMKKA